MARWVIENFWSPVGQGSLAKHRTEYTIATLFTDDSAVEGFDKTVTQRVRNLPGFSGITNLTETIGRIAEDSSVALKTA
jgi:hypothetical protein